MMILNTTIYSFDNIKEYRSIKDFEDNHDSKEWIKRVNTQDTSFTRIETFFVEAE